MFKKITIEIPLLDVIQYMPKQAKFLKEVYTQKRFSSLPRNTYFPQVVDSLHMVHGVVKYMNTRVQLLKVHFCLLNLLMAMLRLILEPLLTFFLIASTLLFACHI